MMKRKLWLILGLVLIVAFTLTACSSSDDDNESPAKAITAYSIAGSSGTINETAKTIAVNVPFGTSVTAIAATFTTTGKKVEVGSVNQVSGTTTNNFSLPVAYKVTAEDGSSVTYTVTVVVAASSAKAITAFSIGSNVGTINEAAKTIAVNVLWGKDLSALEATFSTTGANVKVGSMVQISGDTANNFSSPVVYTVTAANASTQDYTVTVTANLGGSWTTKTDFGGAVAAARSEAVAFGILNGKGYMGTGWNGTTYYSDFWEYDAAANTWAQKTSFGVTAAGVPALARKSAVAFSIGTKGYVGTGYDGTTYRNDFWEYDPAGNTWTRKANLGATASAGAGVAARADAVGFSIMNTTSEGKGYVGTGYDGTNYYDDFYEYTTTTDTWTARTDFPGTARAEAVGLSISTKGYVGTGLNGTTYYQDFYEFNPAANTWTRKADFAGGLRAEAIALYGQCSEGYVGLGYVPCYDPCGGTCECGEVCTAFSDFWEYNAITNEWTQKAYYDGGELTGKRAEAAAFSLSSTSHFVGTGWGCAGTQTATSLTPTGFYKDFWKYTP